MVQSSTTRAFQQVLASHRFSDASSFDEQFAQLRFAAKFEEPDARRTRVLADECWSNWILFDRALPKELILPPGVWYRVRADLHKALRSFRNGEFRLPRGSEFNPTRGANSVEARLAASRWTCTPDAFEEFASLCYGHKGLKRAVKQRYTRWFAKRMGTRDHRSEDRYLYRRFKAMYGPDNVAFHIFSWKLSQVVDFVHGARFTTVPKNNEKRRPINIEPFGNLLVQSSIGEGIRGVLKDYYNVDLDTLATRHRRLISDVARWATIDLKNASDSVSTALVEFLFPPWFINMLNRARSPGVYGGDSEFHITQKISAMGNGFTFELMSLILNSLVKCFDSEASVFGDDIIIEPSMAPELIRSLTSVGFVVNEEKSFLSGPFRESCGCNYHVETGYIESYDFRWPENIGDCVIIYAKAARLARKYPSFSDLYTRLTRAIPKALHGGPDELFLGANPLDIIDCDRNSLPSPVVFPSHFVTPRPHGRDITDERIRSSLRQYGYDPDDFSMVTGFKLITRCRTETLRKLKTRFHWAKYEMYLASGRVVPDALTGSGEWRSYNLCVNHGRVYVARSLVNVSPSVPN